MHLYQLDKMATPLGPVLKTKHVLANNDREAVRTARADEDCPICEIRRGGERVGAIT
jgi:hypothetical protein